MTKKNGTMIIAFIMSFALLLPSMSLAFEFPKNSEERAPVGDKIITYAQAQGYTRFATLAEQFQKVSYASYLYRGMVENAQKLSAQLTDLRESFANFRESLKAQRQGSNTSS